MKYELQTIPVWAAYEQKPQCVLCHLQKESESRNQTFFLGNSIMAPEMRVKLNERGFCPRHFHMLAEGTGKLGYSLALKTHLDSLSARITRKAKPVRRARRAAQKSIAPFVQFLKEQERDCLMCERIAHNVLNYTYTIAKLYADEEDFRREFSRSHGFCVHHLTMVLEMGAEVLPGSELEAWHKSVFDVQQREIDQIREDLEAFTWQFDYQSDSKTPDHAQDAVPRAVQRLAGFK